MADTPGALEEAQRESQVKYLKQYDIVPEIDRALEGLFSASPEAPVAWLARFFTQRASELGQSLTTNVTNVANVKMETTETILSILTTEVANSGAFPPGFAKALYEKVNGAWANPLTSLNGTAVSEAGALLAKLPDAFKTAGIASGTAATFVEEFTQLYAEVRDSAVEANLYNDIGGSDVLRKAAARLMDRIQEDSTLSPFFSRTTPSGRNKLQTQLVSFISSELGGPNTYSGKTMRDAHRDLVQNHGLSQTHMESFAEHLGFSLQEVGVGGDHIDDVLSVLEGVRTEVLCFGDKTEKPTQRASLFGVMGAMPAMEAAMEILAKNLRSDPILLPFFERVESSHHKELLQTFLTKELGGPNRYSGRSIAEAHRQFTKTTGRKISDAHFEAFSRHVLNALEKVGSPEEVLKVVDSVLETHRDDIVSVTEDEKDNRVLYKALGGADAVSAAVELFYTKVLGDSSLAYFFDGVDMARVKNMQKQFLTIAFGGPHSYKGRGLQDAHRRLVASEGLRDIHFDKVIIHLSDTLSELGVSQELVNEAVLKCAEIKQDVLGPERSGTLFENIGGSSAVEALVDTLHNRVLYDPRINFYFSGVDMARLKKMQTAFFAQAFEGPREYQGVNMREAHKNLVNSQGLEATHFEVFIEHFATSLSELKVRADVLDEALIAVKSLGSEVLTKPTLNKPLYQRLGGASAVKGATDIFYQKVLKDERVLRFFAGVDMNRLREQQSSFLSFAFGADTSYTGRTLASAHRALVRDEGLDDGHFDVIVEILSATLKEMGAGSREIKDAAAVANSVRGQVLGKDSSGLGSSVPKPSKSDPLFKRIGGAPAVDAAVELFYTKVMADDKVAKFFAGVDMKKQKMSQRNFLTVAFGGPNNYTGNGMRKAHERLVKEKGLNDTHFDAIMGHLGATLTELKVPSDAIAEAAAIAESVRNDVLCKEEPLFTRIGGAPAVEAAVDLFYTKVMADEKVSKFFAGVDMRKQKMSQRNFLTVAFGGPNNYTGSGMRKAHERLVKEKGLNDSHFDAIMGHLGATLTELKVPADAIAEAAAIAESVRNDVLCKEEPLFTRIGGAPAVEAAVDLFYTKVMADEKVSKFFAGVDMRKQKMSQRNFLTVAFGGPNNYTGSGMRKAHERLVKEKGLNDTHFDAIMGHLGATLTELKVPADAIAEAAAIAESVRNDVLCKEEPLFTRIGGAPAVEAAVDLFYTKVMADEKVSKFFAGVDMRKQKMSQRNFLTVAFGGPNNYTGSGMRKAHERLVKEKGLNDTHFDAIMGHLGATLTELKVPSDAIAEAAAIAESVRNDVLCKEEPLFTRIGGAPAVEAAVDLFYTKVMADEKVSKFFAGVDMRKQKMSQRNFLTVAFGGPNNYTGSGMRKAHERLVKEKGLNDSHFDAIMGHLGATLTELKVPADAIAEAAAIAESVRNDVLCKEEPLFTRIGGAPAVEAAVDLFYTKVMADEKVSKFFAGVDMRKQKMSQRNFLTVAFGGPNNYTGSGMRKAHERLVKEKGLNDSHFDAIMGHLGATLTELKVPSDAIAEAAAIAESVRNDVLCKEEPLFTRIGGAPAVEAAVDLFYTKVMADEKVSKFFAGVDMRKQKMSQRNFLTVAFGGPNNYTGSGMRKAHERLVKEKGLNDSHFDAIMGHLGATLTELKVPADAIAEAAAIAESVRNDVLCKTETLYERIGGAAAVEAAVDEFYKRVTSDPAVSHFFEGISMSRQRHMQRGFLTAAFDGPNTYTGDSMRKAHERLVRDKGLNGTHFNIVIAHLGATLTELGVHSDMVAEAAAIAEGLRDEILGPVDVEDSDKEEADCIIFETLGQGKVEAIVSQLFSAVQKDDMLAPFFKAAFMTQLQSTFTDFLASVWGDELYLGKNMRVAHKKTAEQGMQDEHFDRFLQHLKQSMKEQGCTQDAIKEGIRLLDDCRDDILCKPE